MRNGSPTEQLAELLRVREQILTLHARERVLMGQLAPLVAPPKKAGRGHHSAGTQAAGVLDALAKTPTLRVSELARLAGRSTLAMGSVLDRLLGQGQIVRVSKGVYSLPPDERKEATQ